MLHRCESHSALELSCGCLPENNALSVLHYVIKVTLHLMLHLFEIHSVLELSRTALLYCPLARLLVGNKQAQLYCKWLFTLFYKYLQHYYSQLSIRQTSRKSRYLDMVPSFLQCCTLTFCKADISPRRTLMPVPVVPVSEGLTYCLDFSHRRPLPVSDHFVVHQGWSLTRELTVYSTLAKSLQLILEISATYNLFRSRF